MLLVRNTLASAAAEGARTPRPLDRGPADGAARTRQQIDGAISGRFARDVDARGRRSTARPASRSTSARRARARSRRSRRRRRGHRPRGRGARREPRRRGEDGSALVELTWLGILLLVPLLWIVLSVFEVQRGAFAVSGAARAAGRAYALAPTDAVGQARAEAAARQALADQGFDGQALTFDDHLPPYPGDCHSGVGDHCPHLLQRRPAAAARRPRRRRAELRARRHAHGADRPVPGGPG